MSNFEFSDLFKNISRREFLNNYHDQKFYFEKGAVQDIHNIFSWQHLNDLFNRPKLWNGDMIELAINGQLLEPAQFCRPGLDRIGDQVLRPDLNRVNHFLRQGATLVLDFLEGIHPSVRDIATCLERLTGASTSCNAYCSWERIQGYASHFDTMCVFAIQIEGEKTWNLYNGRVREPMAIPGSIPSEFSVEQHDRQKGSLAKQIVMRPGDVLYLPRGLYHDALATDTASLHLSFGATYLAGFSAVSLLVQELKAEEFFRKRLPHFDDGDELKSYLSEVGSLVGERLGSSEFQIRVKQYMLQNLGDKTVGHALPNREATQYYMVTRQEVRLLRRGPGWRLEFQEMKKDIDAKFSPILKHILASEHFWSSDVKNLVEVPEIELRAFLDELENCGIIWPLAV